MIILCLNNKGGVGKTTLALEVASAFADQFGAQVQGVDLDASVLEIEGETFETGGSFLDWARSRSAQSSLRVPVLRPSETPRAEELLALGAQHDLLIMDGPIALSQGTFQALIAADLVLVPLRPAIFDVRATANLFARGARTSLLGLVAKARARLHLPPARVLGVVNFAAPKTQNRELREVRAQAAAAGIELLPAVLTQRVAFLRAQEQGESVLTARPQDPAAAREVKLLATCVYGAYHGASGDALEELAKAQEPDQALDLVQRLAAAKEGADAAA